MIVRCIERTMDVDVYIHDLHSCEQLICLERLTLILLILQRCDFMGLALHIVDYNV
jgi:hypothetical protein